MAAAPSPTHPTAPTVYFDDIELDVAAFTLRRAGEIVAVEPQVFEVLTHLVEHRDRVVLKTELLDEIWGDRFVSESALTSRIKTARQAIGDDGRTQKSIRTVHGRGYQFIAPLIDRPSVGDAAAASPDDPGAGHGTRSETGGQRSEGPAEDRGPAALSAASSPANAAVHDPNALIGRERELADIAGRLAGGQRLVTLVGPGGVGKTRLAEEIARMWEDSEDRIIVVELDAAHDADLVASQICDGVGVRADSEVDRVGVIAESLRDESVLLVLDNFEHVIDAAAVVATLLDAVPGLRCLVTSRMRLRLSHEQVVDIAPLAVDHTETRDGTGDETRDDPVTEPAAVALFAHAARSADPAFVVDADNRQVISDICALVDGLPLAIGLAAAQLRYVSLDYLRAHLETEAGSIEDDVVDRPDRQNSVAGLIDWSYRLLTPAQQQLLERLAVFEGPCSLAGATAVGAFTREPDALRALTALVDRSLIRPDAGTSPSFTMLNLIRSFGRDRLAERPDAATIRRRHTDHIAEVVRTIEGDRWEVRAGSWLDDLAQVHGDITAVLERSVTHESPDAACRIIGDLNVWWYRTGRHAEGRRWFDHALAHLDDVDDLAAGRIRLGAGFMAFSDRDVDRARSHYVEAIEHARRAGDWRYLQVARANLSATSLREPDERTEALARLDEVITDAEARGERSVLAHALNVSGVLLRFAGEPEQAHGRYLRALEANRAIGDRFQEAMNLGNLGHLAGAGDDLEGALGWSRAALGLAWRERRQVMCAWIVGEIADLLCRTGDHERSAQLLAAADVALDTLGAHRGPTAHQTQPDDTRAHLQEALDGATFDRLTDDGRSMSLERATELALADPA